MVVPHGGFSEVKVDLTIQDFVGGIKEKGNQNEICVAESPRNKVLDNQVKDVKKSGFAFEEKEQVKPEESANVLPQDKSASLTLDFEDEVNE